MKLVVQYFNLALRVTFQVSFLALQRCFPSVFLALILNVLPELRFALEVLANNILHAVLMSCPERELYLTLEPFVAAIAFLCARCLRLMALLMFVFIHGRVCLAAVSLDGTFSSMDECSMFLSCSQEELMSVISSCFSMNTTVKWGVNTNIQLITLYGSAVNFRPVTFLDTSLNWYQIIHQSTLLS